MNELGAAFTTALGLIRTQSAFEHLDGAGKQRLGLIIAPALAKQDGEIIHALRHIGMINAEFILANIEAPAHERLGGFRVAHGAVQGGQIVQAGGHVGVVGSEAEFE